jgi:putative membrane protein
MRTTGTEEQSDAHQDAKPLRLPWGQVVMAHKPYPNEMRDHLANVRTFLAWVRTAITMMGFGFVVAKFGILLRELPGQHIQSGELRLATIIGAILVLVGAVFLALSTLDFLSVRKQIERQVIAFSPVIHIILAGVLLVVAIAVAVYIWITGFQ